MSVFVHKQDLDQDRIVDKTFGLFLMDVLTKSFESLEIAAVITMIPVERLRDIISGNHKGITMEEVELVSGATGIPEEEMKYKACNGATEYYI